MIDEKIVTKQVIISYLSSFIRLRQFDSKFEIAIDKWREDIDFVRRYRAGEYKRYGVEVLRKYRD